MNKTWNLYIFNAMECFTLIVLFLALMNLANGYPLCKCQTLLKIFGFILLEEFIVFTLSYVTFRKRTFYVSVKFFLTYMCFLIFSFFSHWFDDLGNWIFYSILFLVIYIILHIHLYFLQKAEADDINQYLKKRKQP